MDAYVTTRGTIDFGTWEVSCPFEFADGFADYGQMMDLFARVATSQLGYNLNNGSDWLMSHYFHSHTPSSC